MVSLTIDGKTVEAQEGTTVLRAAEQAGIKIPTLCDHAHLTPYGGCRLCIVDVQGFRVPIASCTLPVSQGMVVRTNTDQIQTARRFILSLLFSERNHFCPFCQVSGGDCELQNAAYDQGMTHWPMQPNWNTFPVDTSHPYFVLDNNRCILCRRCVRACAELSGNFTLSIAERGARSILVADFDVPLGQSTCISCGSCVQSCPTGALIDRQSAYLGQEVKLDVTESVCVGCSVGCGIKIYTRDNHIVRIEGDWDAEVNHGVLCKNGRFVPVNDERQRVTRPLVRKDGELQPATWEEALNAVAAHLKPLKGKAHDGVAAIASTRLPAETLSSVRQLFAEQLGSQMVTSLEEGVPSALPATVAAELGHPYEGKLQELGASDCVVAIGVDLIKSHEVAGFMVKRNLPKGAKLVVIDPKENSLDEMAHYTLKAARGTDLDVLLALQAAVIKQDLAKINAPRLDVDKILAELPAKTGISAETILSVAQVIAHAINPVFVYGKGITATGTPQTLHALITLARLIGALTAERSQLISIKGEANSLAAVQYHLDQPFQLNGHQAVFVALGDDHPSKRLLQRLEKAPYLVVQASYLSPLTAMANVVLPVEMWAEQEGHYANLEGRLQQTHKAVQAPEGVWANEAVLAALAERLGLSAQVDWKAQLMQRIPSAPLSETH